MSPGPPLRRAMRAPNPTNTPAISASERNNSVSGMSATSAHGERPRWARSRPSRRSSGSRRDGSVRAARAAGPPDADGPEPPVEPATAGSDAVCGRPFQKTVANRPIAPMYRPNPTAVR